MKRYKKIDLVYWSAGLLGWKLTIDKARQIADRFTEMELVRVFLRIKNAGRRRKV